MCSMEDEKQETNPTMARTLVEVDVMCRMYLNGSNKPNLNPK